VGARFSVQTGRGAHPASCTTGTGSFPSVKSCRGVTLTHSPLLVPLSRKSRAIPLLPLWAVGLYRASVPVQGCTLANCRTPITSNEKVRCTQVFVYSARKIDNLTTGLRGEVVIALEDGTDTLFRNVGKE